MADKSDELLARMFGLPGYSISPIQAGALGAGAFLASEYLSKNPIDATLNKIFGIDSASKINKRTTENVLATSSELNKSLADITDTTMGAIKARQTQVEHDIASSATARGLDAKTATESASQFGASTSGAYAAAHRALAEASAGATARMSGAMSNYYQGLAKQQFQQQLQQAADNAGIIGTITGIASSIMAKANLPTETPTDITAGINPYGTSVSPKPTLESMAPKEQASLPTQRTTPSTTSPFILAGLNDVQQGA